MAQHRSSGAKDLVITCIKGDGKFLKFWALPLAALDTVKSFESHFLSLKSELDSLCGVSRIEQIPVGSKCVVKSKIKNDRWCRAGVLRHQNFNSILVQLLDYGNEETVFISDVRTPEDQVMSFPAQVIECILADVTPVGSEWSKEAITFCEHHLLYNTLSCFVVSEFMKLPIVRVAKKGEGGAFVQRLIDRGLAQFKRETTTPPPTQSISYKMNNMDPNSKHLVRVSCIENAHRFYVQLSAAEMELKHLMDTINGIPRENFVSLKLPAVNTPCLAMLSTKPCYYRALITYIQQSRCKVFFVDYGFTELKEVQELRAIHPSFLQLSAQAICCSLPKEADIDAEEFKRMIGYEHLELTVLNRTPESYIVKLSCRGRDLVKSPMLPQNYVQQKINPGSKCEVIVSFVNDVSEFHCQLNQLKDQLNIISGILNSGCNFVPVSLSECTQGKPVCVKFSEDNLWYRARIMKVNHENDIEVFFVDYGNYDNVGLNDIRNIGPDLLKYPIQAFKCFLYETPIPSDSKMRDDAFELLEELTADQCLLAHVNTFSVDTGYGITLYMKNSMSSINEKLQSSCLSVPVVPVNDIENVYVTVFDSPFSFFVQFEKLDSDHLAEMQEEINTFYSGRVNTSFVPKEGSLVCARFEDDDQFYRARVEKCKDMSCSVFFIDYGNRETIPTKDVHCIDPKFTKYPQFGTECILDNCSQVPTDQLSSVMLENSIQVRMVKKEDDKWHVSLVENHPGNTMILKLIRDSQAPAPRSIHGTGLGGYQDKSNFRSNHTDSWNNNNKTFQPPKNEETFSKRDFQPTQRDGNVRSHNNEYAEKETSFYSKGQVNKPNSFSNEEHIKVSPKKAESAQQFEDYWVISIPPKACRNVYISFVSSPGEFYCQIEEENSKLLSLMKQIEDTYTTNSNDLNMTNFTIGASCCAMYEDDVWYRGKIKKVDPDSCLVFFVDYGNTDAVSKSKIKILKKEFFRWPIQAVCCKSFNLSPKGKDWNDDEINAFIDMTLEKSFIAQFVECDSSHCYSVNLVSIGKLENDIFNKEFVTLGYGRLQDSSKSLVLNPHAASTNLSFSVLDVAVGSSESVQVTFGLNPGEIFCQLKSNMSEFSQMMINLQKYYNNVSEAEYLIDRPHQGMICVAQFHLDCAWYRAEIKKVEAKNIIVFFVDYGNAEAVDRKKIRSITQEYTTLPVQAVKCRIRGIKPPGKSWTVNDHLSKYFEGDAVCKFISKDDDFYLVDMTCNQKNVAEWLIADKFALPDESVQIGTSTMKTVQSPQLSTVRPNISSEFAQPLQALPARKDSFVPGQLLSVTVSFIESPLKFWCQLLDESETLDQLMADIESNISEYPLLNSAASKIGTFCMAQYSEDEAWYRAQIKSTESGNTCKVFFVDYGNSEAVSLSEMKSMPPELMSYPPQCFECSLLNTPLKILPEMTTLFRDTIAEVDEITAKVEYVKSGVSTLTLLFDKDDQEMNVSELLFGIREPSHENGDIVKEFPRFSSPDVPLGLHDGYISVVNSPQDFYIQLAGTEDSLADLSEALAEVSESAVTVIENTLCIGFACFTKYSEDESWYRAEVIDLQDSTARVLFVDYGNIETVEKNSLKNLNEEHLQMPPQAIKCKLNGIVPSADEWSQEAIDTFQNMVLDSCLGVTFISKDIPASVNIAKDDKEIAQYLVEMELANFESSVEADEAYAEDHLAPAPVEDPLSSLPSDQSYPTRKLSSSKHNVKICYVDSYDKFFVMPLELSTELDTVMATLDILYASDSEEKESNSDVPQILEDPKVSMPCVAKYSEDGAWYRAVITEIDKDNIYVTFVDYGNSEITTVNNLRPLTPELVKIPPIAFESSLFGIEAIPDKEQVITAKLEEYYVEELELEMEICEFSPFKIKLFHNGDVASNFVKDGLAKEKPFIPVTETGICAVSSKMNFEDESLDMSLEYHIQISKRFFSGADKIVGNVKFCEIENDLVVFHVVSTDLEDDLQDLQQKLQDAYCEPSQNLANISCMDFCATKYMEDENWYRAQVLSCEKDKFKVRFIDYGNCETVDKSDIYELLADFTIEPQFSVKCILFGLKVDKNKEIELQNRLDEHVYHEPVELKLCKHSHVPYDLCITSVVCGDTDITEILLNEKLIFHQYVINSQLDVNFKAIVSKIEGEIVFLLPCSVVDERDAFQLKLQNFCKDSDLLSKVNKEYLCAARVDDVWYRVSVLNVSESDVTVDLVDFGSTKVVSTFDFVPLPLDICHQPVFLQPCVVKVFENQTGNAKKIDVNDLSIGCEVLCELQKTYPVVQPISIKVVEIISEKKENDEVSLKEQDIETVESTEDKDIESLEEFQQTKDGDDKEQHDTDADTLVEQEFDEKEKLPEEDDDAIKESDDNLSGLLKSDESNAETTEIFEMCENETVSQKYEKPSDSLLGDTHKNESEHLESKIDNYEDTDIKLAEDVEKIESNFKSDASNENEDIFKSDASDEEEGTFKSDASDENEGIIEASNVVRESVDLGEIESHTFEPDASKENENALGDAETRLDDVGEIESNIVKPDVSEGNENARKADTVDEVSVDDFKSFEPEESGRAETELENFEESESNIVELDAYKENENTVESGDAEMELKDVGEIVSSIAKPDASEENESSVKADNIDKEDLKSFEPGTSEANENIMESGKAETELGHLEETESNIVELDASKENENTIESNDAETEFEDVGEIESNIVKPDASEENESTVKADSIDSESVDLKSFEPSTSEESENMKSGDKDTELKSLEEIESNKLMPDAFEEKENLMELSSKKDKSYILEETLGQSENNIELVGDESVEDAFSVHSNFKDNDNEDADFSPEKDEYLNTLKENILSQQNQLDTENAYDEKTQSDSINISEVCASKPLSSQPSSPEKITETEAENVSVDCDGTQLTMSLNSDSSNNELNLKESLSLDEKNMSAHSGKENINSEEGKESCSETKNSIEHINENILVEENETPTKFDDHNHKELSNEENLNCVNTRDFTGEEILSSPSDTCKENNRGIEDSYQLAGSVQVKVSHVAISDGSVIFAVQPLYLQEEFLLLKQSMQEFYSTKAIPYDSNLSSNYCVVYHEGEWCRGKILESGDTTILLIDYGNCTSVDVSNIKALDNDHVNVPPFAVWCTLSSVMCPPEKCEATKAFLCDKLKDCDAVIKVLEGGEPYKINLFVDNLSILNLLLKNNLVTQKLPNIYLEPGSYKAKLSFLNWEDVKIFVNLLSFSDNQNALFESMQSSYKLEESVSNIVGSGIYASLYNGFWYRGLALSSGNDAQVYLVDKGETVTGCENFSFLLPEHCSQPAFAVPCQIPFTDVQATNKIIESISNVLKAAEFSVSIEVCEESNSVKAILTDEHIVNEVESIKLSYVSVTSELDFESSNPVEVKTCDSSNLDLSPNHSSAAAKVTEQEASEHLVSYIEETFTTEPS